MLIHSCSQLVTLTANPQRGGQLGELNIIPDGAVLIEGGTILETGPSQEMLNRFPREEKLDAGGRAVIPGLVDAHTHLVWAGDRAAEFEMRLSGCSYMEIMAAGGGIQSTVNATRAATRIDLLTQTRQRASTIFAMGTTSAEAKTGYEQTLIQRQIDATDRQIDKLVYELYDLTEDEIKIVEGR